MPGASGRCLRTLSRTYASAWRTSRGVCSARAWYLSRHTCPRRPARRLIAFARRTASPCIPRASASRLLDSTSMCTWFDCTENSTTRKVCLEPGAIEFRSAAKTFFDRREGSPGIVRIVTCTGWHGWCAARRRCGTPAVPFAGLRPAPARAPPQVRNSKCPWDRILNEQSLLETKPPCQVAPAGNVDRPAHAHPIFALRFVDVRGGSSSACERTRATGQAERARLPAPLAAPRPHSPQTTCTRAPPGARTATTAPRSSTTDWQSATPSSTSTDATLGRPQTRR